MIILKRTKDIERKPKQNVETYVQTQVKLMRLLRNATEP